MKITTKSHITIIIKKVMTTIRINIIKINNLTNKIIKTLIRIVIKIIKTIQITKIKNLENINHSDLKIQNQIRVRIPNNNHTITKTITINLMVKTIIISNNRVISNGEEETINFEIKKCI